MSELIDNIYKKYKILGDNPETYLNGLLHAKPITYWDYVDLETLLSLQKPRTNFKDESIFIMYHQITELFLKMMLHEVEQIVDKNEPSVYFFVEKIERLNRYTSMLINSFDIMKHGMNYDDYNTFRTTLTPASGFQSVQFRIIELYCTRLENLVNNQGKNRLPKEPTVEDYIEQMYWKDAGRNLKTGEKTLTLTLFEDKYLEQLTALAHKTQGNTIEEKALQLPYIPDALKKALRTFDKLYNIDWPIVHLSTAQHYLDKKGESKAATGGSEWKKYLHPKYQQRKFFPSVWTENEIKNWGETP